MCDFVHVRCKTRLRLYVSLHVTIDSFLDELIWDTRWRLIRINQCPDDALECIPVCSFGQFIDIPFHEKVRIP
jgi:hypothetical protein